MVITLDDIADPATFWNNLIVNESKELVAAYLYQILHDFQYRTRLVADDFARHRDPNRKIEWCWNFNPKDRIQKGAAEAFVSRLVSQKWDVQIVPCINSYRDSKIFVYLEPAQGEVVP